MSILVSEYFSTREAAAELCVTPETLSRWKARRFGPPVTRIGFRDFYHKEKLRRWLRDQERDPAAPEPRRRSRRTGRAA